MKNYLSLLIFVAFFSTNTFAQKVFKDEAYGFSMDKPENWLIADNQFRLANLEKLKIDEIAKSEAIKSNKGSLLLTSFYKYDAKKYAGLIPTIQVNVRTNPTKTFEQFSSAMMQSANGFKNYFPDFKLIKEPSVIEINGTKAVYFIGTYTLSSNSGMVMKVRSRTYAIPNGAYFFQLNFTDEQGKEDDTQLFDELVKSIKIGK